MQSILAFSRASLLTLATLLPIFAYADVYTGTIGRAEVIVELIQEENKTISGQYFYRKYHKDIYLSGQKSRSGELHLIESSSSGENHAEVLLKTTQVGLQGEWIDHQSKKHYPIALSLLKSAPTLTGEAWQSGWHSNSLYETLQIDGLKLKPGKKEKFQGYLIQWWEEPLSKISLFRIIDGLPPPQLSIINQKLAYAQWESVHSYMDCSGPVGPNGTLGYFQQTITPELITPQIISYTTEEYSDCGGAHPNSYTYGHTIDATTGQDLQLIDLLWLAKGPANLPVDSKGERINFDYEDNTLAPWLIQTLAKLHPHEMLKNTKTEDDCDYNNPEHWAIVGWHATPTGIVFQPTFSHVEMTCEDPSWSSIPWHIIKQHPGRKPYLLNFTNKK